MAAVRQMPVLFDQDCAVCTRVASVVRTLDRRGRLELVPFQEARSRGFAADLTDEELHSNFHAIEDGKTLSGPDAIPAVLERLPLGWVPAQAIRRARPLRFLVDRAYRVVSRNRDRFGKECSCSNPGSRFTRPPERS